MTIIFLLGKESELQTRQKKITRICAQMSDFKTHFASRHSCAVWNNNFTPTKLRQWSSYWHPPTHLHPHLLSSGGSWNKQQAKSTCRYFFYQIHISHVSGLRCMLNYKHVTRKCKCRFPQIKCTGRIKGKVLTWAQLDVKVCWISFAHTVLHVN